MRQYETEVTAAPVERRRTEWRRRDVGDVMATVVWAAIWGGAAAVVSGAIALATQRPAWVPLLWGSITFVLFWALGSVQFLDTRFLMTMEEVTKLDLNRDGQIGDIEPQAVWSRVALEGDQSIRVTHPVRVGAELRSFLRAFLGGVANTTFSEGSARLFRAEDAFKDLRDSMVHDELLAWKDPEHHNAGVNWRPGAMPYLRKLASTPPLGGGWHSNGGSGTGYGTVPASGEGGK